MSFFSVSWMGWIPPFGSVSLRDPQCPLVQPPLVQPGSRRCCGRSGSARDVRRVINTRASNMPVTCHDGADNLVFVLTVYCWRSTIPARSLLDWQREPQPDGPRRAGLLLDASSDQTKINCIPDVIVQVLCRPAHAAWCPRLGPVSALAPSPAQTAPILPGHLKSTATPRVQQSRIALPCARALVPRPRLVLVAHIWFCSCVQLSRSALLFLLHISHPHVPHPLQGAGRGPTPLRPTPFVAAAINAVVPSRPPPCRRHPHYHRAADRPASPPPIHSPADHATRQRPPPNAVDRRHRAAAATTSATTSVAGPSPPRARRCHPPPPPAAPSPLSPSLASVAYGQAAAAAPRRRSQRRRRWQAAAAGGSSRRRAGGRHDGGGREGRRTRAVAWWGTRVGARGG